MLLTYMIKCALFATGAFTVGRNTSLVCGLVVLGPDALARSGISICLGLKGLVHWYTEPVIPSYAQK